MFEPFIVCTDNCEFGHLVVLAQNLIHNLVVLSTFIVVFVFAYAGFLLISSGGSTSKKEAAKHAFKMVLIGYLWILVAWLLIYTITEALLEDNFNLLGEPQPTSIESP